MFISVFIGFIILCIIAIQNQHYYTTTTNNDDDTHSTTNHQNSISTSNQYDDTNNYNRTITKNRRRLWPKLISDPKTLEKIDRNSKISREEFYKYKYGDGYDDNSLILPNILFLGAQKAGSTSVRMLLYILYMNVCISHLTVTMSIFFVYIIYE